MSEAAILGTLQTALTSGQTYTSLQVSNLTGPVETSETLTIGYESGTLQTVTVSGPAPAGSTLIAVNSFVASANFPVGTFVAQTAAASGGTTAPSSTYAQATPINAAAVTTTQTGADQSSGGARGLHMVLNMTNAGTGSVTPKIQGKDAQGNYYDILVGTAITTNGMNLLKVYPGIGALANAASPDVIPATFRVVVTANNANATTYTATTSLVP